MTRLFAGCGDNLVHVWDISSGTHLVSICHYAVVVFSTAKMHLDNYFVIYINKANVKSVKSAVSQSVTN